MIPFFDKPRVVSWDMPSQDAKNNRKRRRMSNIITEMKTVINVGK